MMSIQDVFIRDTENDPVLLAQSRLTDRADELLAELSAKVDMATDLDLSPAVRQRAHDRLVNFCTERVLPQLAVLDRAVYAVAAGAAETRLLIRGLRAQQPLVAAAVAELDRATGVTEIAAAAHTVRAVLDARHAVERAALWPALRTLPGVDLPTIVADFETLLAGGSLDVPSELDVRGIPHGRRHPTIFGVYARLSPGEGFVLVNNHDPRPLRREFEAAYPGRFTWDYVESGPERWQVRISRPGSGSRGGGDE